MIWLLLIADVVTIKGARVEDGPAVIVMRDGKLGGAEGGRVIDATGKWVTAGLIEPLSRLGLVEVEAEKDTRDMDSHGHVAPAFRVSDGFNASSVWINDARAEGITSAAVVPHGTLIQGTGAWLDLTPRLDPKPLAMFGDIGRGGARAHGNARGGAWMRLREIIADARFYRANKKAYDDGRTRALTLPLLQLEALLPVLDGSMLLVLHADRAGDIEAALELARTEKLRIAIRGGAEAWRVADALAKAKVAVIMQPSRQTPGSFDALTARDDAPAILDKAGVRIVFTASAEGWIGRLRQEAGIAVSYGLPWASAMRAITLSAAELYRRDAEVGSLKDGKRANVVIWSGDPLELTSVAERVFIDGVEQSLETRHNALVRRYMLTGTRYH